MSRCSYTWEYRYKKKQCPEEIWSGSEEYCIFHDRSEKRNIELFKQKLKEKLNKKDYRFGGYCFPEEVDFSNWKFEEYTDFMGAIFQKDADFSFATFQKNADFSGAIFQEYADFSGATFRNAYFNKPTKQSSYISSNRMISTSTLLPPLSEAGASCLVLLFSLNRLFTIFLNQLNNQLST